jgi:phosphatidylinositol alpha-1,6-mannosyltransferase
VASDRTCAAVIVGRLEARESYKGHRELIEVWPLVRQKVPAAELWVIGDGSLRPAMERLAESVCPGAVTFLGFLSEADKEQRLRQARCLVMPSRGEGFGLVYIEAMRVGTPCLVGTQDAGCEVVAPPEAGIAVDAAARGELVAGVVRLLTPGDEWDRWSAQARRRYESNFTARHFKQRLLDCLHR